MEAGQTEAGWIEQPLIARQIAERIAHIVETRTMEMVLVVRVRVMVKRPVWAKGKGYG
jgi:hypothetical protein